MFENSKFQINDKVFFLLEDGSVDFSEVHFIVGVTLYDNSFYYITDKNLPNRINPKIFAPMLMVREDCLIGFEQAKPKFFELKYKDDRTSFSGIFEKEYTRKETRKIEK